MPKPIEPYKKTWVPRCGWCDRPATYEVIGAWDFSVGTFCEAHADERLEIERNKAKPSSEGSDA